MMTMKEEPQDPRVSPARFILISSPTVCYTVCSPTSDDAQTLYLLSPSGGLL